MRAAGIVRNHRFQIPQDEHVRHFFGRREAHQVEIQPEGPLDSYLSTGMNVPSAFSRQ